MVKDKSSAKPSKVACRYCGMILRIVKSGNTWTLYDDKAPHRCSKMPLSIDQIEKLK